MDCTLGVWISSALCFIFGFIVGRLYGDLE